MSFVLVGIAMAGKMDGNVFTGLQYRIWFCFSPSSRFLTQIESFFGWKRNELKQRANPKL
jgi:hypothetical protein